MQRPLESPDCFGTHLWSATDKECVGGPDPGYTHPQTGARARERCKWYQTCATASAQNRTQSLISPQSLVRQPYQQPASPVPAASTGVQPPPRPVAPHPGLTSRPSYYSPQPSYPQYQHYQQPVHQPTYSAPTSFAPPYVAQMGPMQIPLQYQQPGAQMPAYLTMPEPILPGEGAIKVLARTLFRSMLKAFGHSLSSFVDHTPMQPHRPPEQ